MARCPYDAKHANVALFAGKKTNLSALKVLEFVMFVSRPAVEHISEWMEYLFIHLSYVHLLTTGRHFKLNGRAEYI